MDHKEIDDITDEVYGPGTADKLKVRGKSEEVMVVRLGNQIGYGRMMQLAEQAWRKLLATKYPGTEGGEHSVGPCVSALVPCPCKNPVKCDWCCGAGRVTERVAQAMGDLDH